MDHLVPWGYVPFTAGDLIEGLEFMDMLERRAVIFGLEQGLPSVDRIVELTHAQLQEMPLTDFASAIVEVDIGRRHPRFPFVFWRARPDGVVTQLLSLEPAVRSCFGGMGWVDLLRQYRVMSWVSDQLESEAFSRSAKVAGIPLP